MKRFWYIFNIYIFIPRVFFVILEFDCASVLLLIFRINPSIIQASLRLTPPARFFCSVTFCGDRTEGKHFVDGRENRFIKNQDILPFNCWHGLHVLGCLRLSSSTKNFIESFRTLNLDSANWVVLFVFYSMCLLFSIYLCLPHSIRMFGLSNLVSHL